MVKIISHWHLSIIEDWRRAWKWASVRTPALGIMIMTFAHFLGESWSGLPASLQQYIPHADKIAMFLFIVSMVGRLCKLEKKPNGTESPPDNG